MRKLLQSHYGTATVHGMRASFRTWARVVVNAPSDVAEMALTHSIGNKTTQAYNRADHPR
jgi:integrase